MGRRLHAVPSGPNVLAGRMMVHGTPPVRTTASAAILLSG